MTERLGALPARYALILNPHADAGFTRCPRCGTRANVRKLPLVIHVNGFGLVLLNKTCRLCLRCETLVVHQTELDGVLAGAVGMQRPEYVVLGTLSRSVYRRGLSAEASLEDVKDQMADFKSYWKVDFTPAGWYSIAGGTENNVPDRYIANVEGAADGQYLKATARRDGSFSIFNSRTRETKSYEARVR